MERVKRSYVLMLDFYGAKVVDWQTGELERSSNYRVCFKNLNSRAHNYLRITRLLKWLGEMNLEHLKFAFLVFFANEAVIVKSIPKAAQVGQQPAKPDAAAWLHPSLLAAREDRFARARCPLARDPRQGRAAMEPANCVPPPLDRGVLSRLHGCLVLGPSDAVVFACDQSLEGFWLATLKQDNELRSAVKFVRHEMTLREALELVRAPQRRGEV